MSWDTEPQLKKECKK